MTLTPSASPLLSQSSSPPRKRGRPSKADVERKQAEAIAKGEIILPAVAPQSYAENSNRPTDVVSQNQTQPSDSSLKRSRTLTGEGEDDRPARTFSQPVEKAEKSNTTKLKEASSMRNMLLPENVSLPTQHLSPVNTGSPLRNSTLASDLEAPAPSNRVKTLRVRCPTPS